MGNKTSMKKISPKIEENKAYMEDRLGMGLSFDVGYRELIILKRKVHIYYVTGLCDTSVTQEIMEMLIYINDNETNYKKLPEIIENRLLHQQVEKVKTMDEAADPGSFRFNYCFYRWRTICICG